jgi:hypothetical protein
MRRRNNRALHGWGVVEGLEVRQDGDQRVIVEGGMAIDRHGREMYVAEPIKLDLGSVSETAVVFVTINYREFYEDFVEVAGSDFGSAGYERVRETVELHGRAEQDLEGDELVLARVTIGERGKIATVDSRHFLRKSVKSGWVRLPFRPANLATIRFEKDSTVMISSENEFIVDEVVTYCEERGASGSMHIPVPPGAERFTGFRIAGTTTGEVTVHLVKGGWNIKEGKGIEGELLVAETFTKEPFHKEIAVDSILNDMNTVALTVRAKGSARIYLVAARFE